MGIEQGARTAVRMLCRLMAGCLLVGVLVAQGPPTKRGKEMKLFDLELVTQLEPGIASGGWDTTTDFDRRLVPKVNECMNRVLELCNGWAKDKKLSSVKTEINKSRKPKTIQLQYSSPSLEGIFEITYRVDEERERAQVTFWFYDLKGDRKSGELTNYLGLGPRLLEALQCDK